MGVYRARDLVGLPSIISLARLPLAAAFVWLVDRPLAAFAVLVAAGVSDVLDGWIARKTGTATATGAAVDPITDKIFVLTVVVTLVVIGKLDPLHVVLLSTRELGELPLVAWLATSRRARERKRDYPRANIPGKIATTLQFMAVVAVLFDWAARDALIALAALAGIVAAASYWSRSLGLVRNADRG